MTALATGLRNLAKSGMQATRCRSCDESL